jgi:hypothetical protein
MQEKNTQTTPSPKSDPMAGFVPLGGIGGRDEKYEKNHVEAEELSADFADKLQEGVFILLGDKPTPARSAAMVAALAINLAGVGVAALGPFAETGVQFAVANSMKIAKKTAAEFHSQMEAASGIDIATLIRTALGQIAP